MTTSNISKFNRLVLGVAIAALIAASCGSDGTDVVEPVESVPVETTTAPTTAPAPLADVEDPAASEDAAPTVEQDEAPATTTTAAEPEPVQTAPSLVVDPVTVFEGFNTFTIEGAGFDPSLTTWTLLCPLAGDLTAGTPEDELAAAMASVTPADCDLATAEEVAFDDEGSFVTTRDAFVIGNFMWVASDSAQIQVAAAAVFMEAPEPEPTVTSVPVSVDDLGIDDRALAFLAGELGVQESEFTLTGTETAVWADTSLGCPKEGYAYATVMTPGYKFTFSHGTASHVVHTDELGTYFVRPVGCYEPAELEPTTTTHPESSPETTLPPEEPDDTSTTATPDIELVAADPWARVANEPVLASELWPEGAEDGTPYPDDLYCHIPSDGEFECYYTTPEPESEQVVEDTPQDGSAWVPPVAGMVPEVHPDVPLTEWQRGPVDPLDRAYDKPRTTEGVQQWRNWCYSRWDSCEWLEHNMYQALDYLGANEQCVLNEYTRKAGYFLREGSGANNSYAAENFGWHRCGTVIDPIVGDISDGGPDNDVGLRLSDTPGITLAERCRTVLTGPFPNIELETRGNISGTRPPIKFGQDCDAWAAYVEGQAHFPASPSCSSSAELAEEWMEHNHNQHEDYYPPFC